MTVLCLSDFHPPQRVSGLNVKWAIDDRRSLVELMAYDPDGGMSTRQIGAALHVDHKTVVNDIKAGEEFSSPEPRKIQGSDGKTCTGPTPEEQAGAALGVGKSTIDRDLAGVPNGTPEPRRARGQSAHSR